MSRHNQLSMYKTTIAPDGEGGTRITYHNTVIVHIHRDRTVTLNTGGYYSVTTKRKMNQAAWQFGLGFGVHQRRGVWYLSRWDKLASRWIDEVEYDDMMVIVA